MCYVLCRVCAQLLCVRTILELVLLQARTAAPRDGIFILVWKGEYEISFPFGPGACAIYIFTGLENNVNLNV